LKGGRTINTNIVLRDKNQLEKKINSALSFIEKDYLNDRKYEIIDVNEIKSIEELDFNKSIRLLKLEKFVYEKDEKMISKLSSVYSALHGDNSSVFLLLNSDGKECDLYLGVKSVNNAVQSFNILESSVRGNFPGTKLNCNYMNENIENLMGEIIPENNNSELTSVIGIPSLKNEKNEDFLQGIENLINGMQGKKFSALIIADPISHSQLTLARKSYEDIYTQLSIFKDTTFNLSKNEAITLTETIGESIGKTYNESNTDTESISEGRSTSIGKNSSRMKIGVPDMKTLLASVSAGATTGAIGAGFSTGGLGAPAGAAIGAIGGAMASMMGNESSSTNESVNSNHSTSKANTESYGESKSTNTSTTKGKTEGKNKSIQYVQQNKAVYNLLDKIDTQFERLKIGENNGLWAVGAYFISPSVQDSAIAANIYNGVLKGSDSGIEKTSIRTFYDSKDKGKVMDYLYNFSNPMIYVNDGINSKLDSLTTLTTTDELSMQLNIPKKSVSGLEVVEMASFGRNVKDCNNSINIGKLHHLGRDENKNLILDLDSLSSHTFITGSTGSGKSNTVYKLVDELIKKDIKFLVVEPAKGEYKSVFGGRQGVKVYGTNVKHTELLKINPFKFHEEVHILEHIDRFVEILNAVWPMYAAMPAVLKESIEEAYILKGWDLDYSINRNETLEYPSFKDLMDILPKVIERSGYSEEVKSNYRGSLVTRVRSLTNGLIGRIFDGTSIEDSDLFDENVIIDLSRIGSVETKSMLMAMIFLKLQEYRMSTAEGSNTKLKHVTIIEEAHNLLRKTSTEQSSEGANMQGKSVEMISNSIAEMRTYGEGFIIIDQSPTLLDESVIKNTNTKLILRLPSFEDRQVVGKSMNLNEQQIDELSKLQTGVAAIYQNNWEEAILSKINYFDSEMEYKYSYDIHKEFKKIEENKKNLIEYLFKDRLNLNLEKLDLDELVKFIENTNQLTSKDKESIKGFILKNKKLNFSEKAKIILKLIDGNKILSILTSNLEKYNLEEGKNYQNLHNEFMEMIKNTVKLEEHLNIHILNSILRVGAENSKDMKLLYANWSNEVQKRRMI